MKMNTKRSLTQTLVRAGAGSFLMRILQAFLGLFIAVLLARYLGPVGVGKYGSTIAIVAVILIPIQAGIAKMLVQKVSRSCAMEDWEGVSGFISWSNYMVVGFSAFFGFLILTVWYVFPGLHSASFSFIIVSLPSVPIIGAGLCHAAILGGLRHVVFGQTFDLVRNISIMTVFLSLWLSSISFGPAGALIIFAGASMVGMACVVALTYQLLPQKVRDAKPKRSSVHWLFASTPFVAVGGLLTIAGRLDLIFLGVVSDPEQAGLFHVAMQVGAFLLFGLTSVSLAAAPYFSGLHTAGEDMRLRVLAKRSSQASFLFACCCAIAVWTGGGWIIEAAFGENFSGAHSVLVVISIAYVVQSSTGASSILLSMTGHERAALKVTAISLAIKVAVAAIAIPVLGAVGAAISVLVYFVILNIGLRDACLRCVGVETFALAGFLPTTSGSDK